MYGSIVPLAYSKKMKRLRVFFFLGIFLVVAIAAAFFWFVFRKSDPEETRRSGGEVQNFSEKPAQENEKEVSCIISGCSGNICADKDADQTATFCEWLDEYGCYKDAVCEKQSNGECGWTMTETLKECIQSARENQSISPQEKVPSKKNGQAIDSNDPGDDSSDRDLSIISRPVSWGYETSSDRSIEAIIIHSSYNSLKGEKYDVEAILEIYQMYGVSAHYIIDRGGRIWQLVDEKDIAYHAGVSALPDGRTDVNALSIGVEILNDDKGDAYTEKQYAALNALIKDIRKRRKIAFILGHSDIAPKRKTDPWNFDWKKVAR